ncbi:MAG: flagellar basal body-associated FliL family protein [Planctomycetota bacterium]|nr:flagellar basal body-associated FliL family protein [Planctomycetota bacterium]
MSSKPDDKPKESAPSASDAPAKSKPPIKTIAIVAVIMIVEAAAVFMLAGMTGKAPEAQAHTIDAGKAAEAEASVEIKLLDEKFQNMSQGRTWIWDVSIALKVKKKHEEVVKKAVEARQSEIKETVSLLFRRATPTQLREPGLETLNRQLSAALDKIIGTEAEGESRIERVLVPKCRGFQTD